MDRNAKRRLKYATMSNEKKNALLRKRREQYSQTSMKRMKQWVIAESRSKDFVESSGSILKDDFIMVNLPKQPLTLPILTTCSHCGALKFQGKTAKLCCADGQIALFLPPASSEVSSLLTGTTEQCRDFRANIRCYNNNLAFTTLGAKYDTTLTANLGAVYTFKVQGQMYHFLNPLKGSGLYKAAGVQLYFYDSDLEFEERLKWSDRLGEHVLRILMGVMNDNPYCRFLKQLRMVENLEEKKIVFNSNPVLDQRRYNKPTVSQVAAILVDHGDSITEDDRTIPIQIYSLSTHIFTIKHYYSCYDPLQYPLIFTSGHSGWHLNIKRKIRRSQCVSIVQPELSACTSAEQIIAFEDAVVRNGKQNPDTVTAREYYCYKFHMQNDDKSMLLHMGRLFQQFVVDMYIKIETSRLQFMRKRQSQSRTEMLQGIVDGSSAGITATSALGRRTVLPASFIGGPRDMRRRYLDAMAIVQKYGKPDIFITMTCNPYWPEIQDNLKYGETPNDRPDLLARVFKAKVDCLRNELVNKQLFGKVESCVYVIEYQKRGLPHCHLLMILKAGCKPLSPAAYDRVVCAELPDANKYPYLFGLVTKHMLHGPCGLLNQNNCCMKRGACKDQYPKQFHHATCQTEDGYPLYRRRNDGRSVRVRNADLDNRWVVPYNPYLLALFNCHINVEIFSSIKLIKYVHKYLFKGSDAVSFVVQGSEDKSEVDEIKQYQDARWIGPSEAMWRIFSFKLNHIKPSVYTLQVHLEGQQYLTFDKDANLESISSDAFLARTRLTEFFSMNMHDAEAKRLNLLYKQFPEHFVWCIQSRTWNLRKRRDVIGRMVTMSPSEGERYYLRLLLANVRCPHSYDALMTVGGLKRASFRDAAVEMGLLASDTYIQDALDEACNFQMPSSLRSLFAIILVFCSPVNPEALWLRYKDELSSDLRRVYSCSAHDPTLVDFNVLQIINSYLLDMGKSLNEFRIVPESFFMDSTDLVTREILSERNITVTPDELLMSTRLNADQLNAYNLILGSVFSPESDSFFIDGPGGTGKTFLYRALLATLRSRGFIAIAVASSGVAASALPGGRTAHSRFKIPLDCSENHVCSLSKQSGVGRLIIEAKVIIWDEATMARRESLEAFDLMLKDFMDSDRQFGGKVVVLGGDFRQTLPVIPKATRGETVQASLMNSHLWSGIRKIQLTTNMRAAADPEFCSFLLRVGEGSEPCDDNDEITLPTHLVIPYIGKEEALQSLILAVFKDLDAFAADPVKMTGRCILSATNSNVDRINDDLNALFPGEARTYLSLDRTIDERYQSDFEDLLNGLNPKGIPPHKLVLKINSPIMLIRNLNPTEGLCNGTRLIVRALGQNTITAEISFGPYKGKRVFIPRIPLVCDDGCRVGMAFKRFQLPVKLCFAMTINKSQGQTLDFVGLYLEQPVFSHGHLYVVLSRARTSNAVKVILFPPTYEEEKTDTRTKNIVFTEIFAASDQ